MPTNWARLRAICELFRDDVAGLPTELKIDAAKRAEAAALASIPASPTPKAGRSIPMSAAACLPIRAVSSGAYRSTYCSVSAVPVAMQDGAMERDYWFTMARDFAGLEDPESVGRIAAARAIRRLGAVKVETQNVPVIFEPRIARIAAG